MIRGGHMDAAILGTMQVAAGDLANWTIPGKMIKGVGGRWTSSTAHGKSSCCWSTWPKDDTPKIVRECTLRLTGKRCVQRIITDPGVIDITERGPVLTETAPGVPVEEVVSKTGAELVVATPLAAAAAPDAM